MDIYIEDDIIKEIHEAQLRDKEINETILNEDKETSTEGEHAENTQETDTVRRIVGRYPIVFKMNLRTDIDEDKPT